MRRTSVPNRKIVPSIKTFEEKKVCIEKKMLLNKINSVPSKLSKMTFEKYFCIQKKTVLKKTSVPKRKKKFNIKKNDF